MNNAVALLLQCEMIKSWTFHGCTMEQFDQRPLYETPCYEEHHFIWRQCLATQSPCIMIDDPFVTQTSIMFNVPHMLRFCHLLLLTTLQHPVPMLAVTRPEAQKQQTLSPHLQDQDSKK